MHEGREPNATIWHFCSNNGTGAYVQSNTSNLYVHFAFTSFFKYPVSFMANYTHSVLDGNIFGHIY